MGPHFTVGVGMVKHPQLRPTGGWTIEVVPAQGAGPTFKATSIGILLAVVLGVSIMASSEAIAVDPLEPLREEREAYIEYFRKHGEQQLERAVALEARLQSALQEAKGSSLEALALFELATMQRLTSRFDEAIVTFERSGETATRFGLNDAAFDAWIGVARAHAYGTRDHGAAVEAFRRAAEIAGSDPTPKQKYEMADYASQLRAGRGELEAALVSAIEANRFARDEAERFYAQLDAADVLQKFAESCDYRKLVDAKTASDEGDTWGACRRAVGAAKSYYEEARESARKLGWDFLLKETEGFISRLGMRLLLIDQRASFEKMGTAQVFTAQDIDDVLVNEDFAAGASELSEYSALGPMLSQLVPDTLTNDPRSLYLLGVRADLDGDSGVALDYLKRAVTLLERERSSMFDLRRRGTVVENRPELVRDLALRLLSLGQYEDAFRAFESIRARGLAELAAIFESSHFTDTERHWLAELAQLESQESAILKDLVETTIAGIEHSKSVNLLERLEQTRAMHREMLEMKDFRKITERLASAAYMPATLGQLQELVRESNIPVLFYWVTHTNVVVWIISPQSMEIRTVFLPEVAVIQKVSKLVESIRTTGRPYDQTAARELHTYLVQPFVDHLKGKQILIVPQGPLVTLPYEALIDTRTGGFFVETMAISYAPNAFFASRALQDEPSAVTAVTAVFDEELEQITGEVSRIGENRLIEVTTKPSRGLSARATLELLGRHGNVHVLLHGIFDQKDPLQSRIRLNNPELSREENEVTSAELLAVDWRDTHLAVFSSCEGAMMNIRISNEIFGLSWAPLVGGVDHVLLSRWRVQSDSNADWMASFYDSVASEHVSPALAAAQAMRRMIAGERSDPFYWAGPQVFGR